MTLRSGTLRPILIAEDNANDLELIQTALEEAHLSNEIVVARDGEAAMDYLRRQGAHSGRETPTPALVVLDLKMPRVDGREVGGREGWRGSSSRGSRAWS